MDHLAFWVLAVVAMFVGVFGLRTMLASIQTVQIAPRVSNRGFDESDAD